MLVWHPMFIISYLLTINPKARMCFDEHIGSGNCWLSVSEKFKYFSLNMVFRGFCLLPFAFEKNMISANCLLTSWVLDLRLEHNILLTPKISSACIYVFMGQKQESKTLKIYNTFSSFSSLVSQVTDRYECSHLIVVKTDNIATFSHGNCH